MNISKNNWYKLLIVEKSYFLLFSIILFLLLSAVLGYITPISISKLFDSYEQGSEFNYWITVLIAIFGAEYVNRVLYQTSVNFYLRRLLFSLRNKCYSSWINSYESFSSGSSHKDRYPLGEILTRILNDTSVLQELVSSGSFAIFIDIFFIISCLISFISLNTTSGIFLILAEATACGVLIYGSKFMWKIYMNVRSSNANMSRELSNIIGGVSQSYYTDHNNYAAKRSLASFEDFLSKQLKANIWDASYYSIAESLYPLLLALLVLVIPYSKLTELAVLAAILDLIQRSISPIKDVASKISNIQRARTGLVRITEFLDDLSAMPASHESSKYELNLNISKISIRVDQFSYLKKPSENDFQLKNISFEAKQGESIGIVGLSGCGKSTLLKILTCDILAPNSLIEIIKDDTKVGLDPSDALSISNYRQYIGLVSQDSHVFTRELKFNITLGINEELFDEFWKKVESQISYLKNWSVCPETIINPTKLSLGQKQLIAGLRACFLRKPIVLMDEVSSGLDADLELALRELILLIQSNSITIVVAHRVETIVHSSKIILMDNGEVSATGTHHSLKDNNALYDEFIAQVSSLSNID